MADLHVLQGNTSGEPALLLGLCFRRSRGFHDRITARSLKPVAQQTIRALGTTAASRFPRFLCDGFRRQPRPCPPDGRGAKRGALRQYLERPLLPQRYAAPGGFLIALKDNNGTGRADVIERFGPGVPQGSAGGTGVALYNGYVYAEENDKIVRYKLPTDPNSIAPKGAA